ncbi:hypothetical protein ACF08B_38905 [Streptomyces sp. NPDC015139]|uniref:hypothetical protein n=1 Tax=Streptomyces sp. NPDC015139 TaxID=3364942 RepID=UPI0036FBCB49
MTIDQTPSYETVFCPYLPQRTANGAGARVLVSVDTDFICPRFRAPDHVLQNGPDPSEVPDLLDGLLEEVAVDELCDDDGEWSETSIPEPNADELTLYQLGPVETGPECEPGEGCRERR